MINKNQQALLELLKASLFGTEPLFPDGVNWSEVLKEAQDQTVVALAASAVPKEEIEKWQKAVGRNKLRFFQILDEQALLVQLFDDANIPMVIIKGNAAAMYYPIPLNRTMGDIDFVVAPDYIDDANKLMAEKGYVFSLETERHFDYEKKGIEIELHHHYCDSEWNFESMISDGLSNAVSCELYGKQFMALPEEINGLVLLDHVRRHIKKGLGLRQIIDWMMYVHTSLNSDTAWEDRFAPLARSLGLETLAVTLTKMCRTWLGLPDMITWCDNANNETAQQILELVFHFGNFGIKNQNEHLAMESFSVGIRRHGLLRYLQTTGEKNWTASQNHKSLRPFAWIYQSFRYFGKGTSALLHGERFSKDISKGTERIELYKKLNIDS